MHVLQGVIMVLVLMPNCALQEARTMFLDSLSSLSVRLINFILLYREAIRKISKGYSSKLNDRSLSDESIGRVDDIR